MEVFAEALGLLFGADWELRQILWVTLKMSLSSTAIAVCIGVPLGVLLGTGKFRGRKLILKIIHTLMALPPVVAGLIVFCSFPGAALWAACGCCFRCLPWSSPRWCLLPPSSQGSPPPWYRQKLRQ